MLLSDKTCHFSERQTLEMAFFKRKIPRYDNRQKQGRNQKKMKKLITIIMLAITLLTLTVPENVQACNKQVNKDKALVNLYCKTHYNTRKYKVKYIKQADLTNKKLKTRKQKKIIYVEVIKSVSTGLHHGYTADYDYIYYNKKVKKGKTVTSYFVYNPKTNAVDDVVAVVDNGRIR